MTERSKPSSVTEVASDYLLYLPPPPPPPPLRLILESGGCGVCEICGSSLRRDYVVFGKARCIQPLCKSNARLHRTSEAKHNEKG